MELNPNERIDDLEIKGYRIIQNSEMFCFGVDAVLLANFASARKNEIVLDMCTGNGIVAMLLEAKTAAKHITGIDILEKNIDMANRSIRMNGQTDRIDFVCDDIKNIKNIKNIYKGRKLDVVTCNPPYMGNDKGIKNESTEKLIARHEIMCSLEDVVSSGSDALKYGGRMYMIHRPGRLAEIIYIMKKHDLEPKRLRMVHSFVNKKPTMILIEARKNGGIELVVEPPLIIYDGKGVYSEEIMRMYGK